MATYPDRSSTPMKPLTIQALTIIAEILGKRPEDLKPEDKATDHGDSLDLVDCVIALEEDLGITLDDDDFHGNVTIGRMVELAVAAAEA